MSNQLGAGGFEPVSNPAERRAQFDLRRQTTDLQKGHFSLLEGAGATNAQWTDLRVPLNSTSVGAVRAPTYLKWLDNGAGSTGLYGYSFSATVEEEVFFDAQLPHAYKLGSRIAPHLHYILRSTPTAGQTLRFGLEYSYSNVDGTFPNTTIIYALETFTGAETANTQYIAGFDPDIEDANINVSAMICCRLFRDTATDTYSGEPVVLEFDFHYQSDSIGSDGEFQK